MTSSAFIQVLLYLGVLFMLAYPLAGFMVKRMQAPLSATEQRNCYKAFYRSIQKNFPHPLGIQPLTLLSAL